MDGEIQAETDGKHTGNTYIFRSKMCIRTKTKILKSSVLPVLIYGAQTWALIKHQMSKQVIQNLMLRFILGILEHKIKNEEIYSRTNSTKTYYIIKKLK